VPPDQLGQPLRAEALADAVQPIELDGRAEGVTHGEAEQRAAAAGEVVEG
jgi:hypothetical protein